jgi:hypothetical protein
MLIAHCKQSGAQDASRAKGNLMSKFLTIGYGEESGYAQTDPCILAAAHANDERLQADGALVGIAGPPVQVRNHRAAQVEIEQGPFMSAPMPVAGFALIEAATIDEAIELVSGSPCAVADGVIEVWPIRGS